MSPSQPIIEGSWNKNSGQEPVGRNASRSHGGTLFAGLLSITYSAYVIVKPRSAFPGVAQPTVIQVFSHQLLTEKMATGLPTGQCDEGIFSMEFPFSRWPWLMTSWQEKLANTLQVLKKSLTWLSLQFFSFIYDWSISLSNNLSPKKNDDDFFSFLLAFL